MRRDPFHAIADPTRRAIIELVADRPLNLNAVAGQFPVSRPAISKHIKILNECGLILVRQQGRERYCEVNFKGLHEVADWIEQYSRFWNRKLDALAGYLEKEATNSKKIKGRTTSKKAATHKLPLRKGRK